MLDTGSDRDVVSDKLVQELGLRQRIKPVTIQTVEATITEYRHFADYRLQSLDGSYGADVTEALVGQIVASKNDIPPAERDLSALHHLNDIVFDSIDAEISMIIGVNHIEAWAEQEIRRGSPCQPIAMKTRFGWTLVGGWARNSTMNIAYHQRRTTINDAILHRDVEKSFLHDDVKMPENVGEKAYSETTSVYDFIF